MGITCRSLAVPCTSPVLNISLCLTAPSRTSSNLLRIGSNSTGSRSPNAARQEHELA